MKPLPSIALRTRLRFWLITFAALATMAVTASLGRWQLSRAAQKQALQAAIDERQAMPPASVAQLLSTADAAQAAGAAAADPEIVHRQAQLQGHWVARHTVFLDNRQMQGRPGFFVVTPLVLQGTQTAVLVQRGWVPRDFQERTRLPDIATPDGLVQVSGRIAAAPSRMYELGASSAGEGSSRIRQNLDLAAFGAETGLALLPLSVLQAGNAGDGLRRDWPVIDSGVDKHYGYAFQWFGLCGLVAILYVWFQIVRPFRNLRSRGKPAA